jgi:hypothetical protein
VNVRNPKPNSKMLSGRSVISHRFLIASGDLLTAGFCHGLISHADRGMKCKLVASNLCFRRTCCLNFQGWGDRRTGFPKNVGNHMHGITSHKTESFISHKTCDCKAEGQGRANLVPS